MVAGGGFGWFTIVKARRPQKRSIPTTAASEVTKNTVAQQAASKRAMSVLNASWALNMVPRYWMKLGKDECQSREPSLRIM